MKSKQRSFEDFIDTSFVSIDADLLLIWMNNFQLCFLFHLASCPVLPAVLIISRGECMKILEENVNLDLQHVCCWLQANKLSLNTLKCKHMIIESQHNLSQMNYIPSLNTLGQLGVTIDDQLKWDKHVDKLYKKLSSALSNSFQ